MNLSEEQINRFATLVRDWQKLSEMDNRQLAWLVLELFNDFEEVFGRKALIIDEVVNRLYPEWDGENIEKTDTGWRTPKGEINYIRKQ